jgi:hypothetical protein
VARAVSTSVALDPNRRYARAPTPNNTTTEMPMMIVRFAHGEGSPSLPREERSMRSPSSS